MWDWIMATIVSALLLSLTLTFAFEVPAAQQPLHELCGNDLTLSKDIPHLDACARRLFLESGCTTKGTLWNDMSLFENTNQSPVSMIRFHAQSIYQKAQAGIAIDQAMCGANLD